MITGYYTMLAQSLGAPYVHALHEYQSLETREQAIEKAAYWKAKYIKERDKQNVQ